MKRNVLSCVLAFPLIVGSFGVSAKPPAENLKLNTATSSHVIKNQESIEALTVDQVYDITHDINLYNLYMIDQAYNISDQYVDRIIASAKDMTDVDFMRTFSEMKLTTAQKKEFNDYIAAERKINGFDLVSRANLMVRMDNAFVLNKMVADGIEPPPKPVNFREFNVDDYFNAKYDSYILAVKQISNYELTEIQKNELIKVAGALPKQSLIKMVENTPFKKKLRDLISQEIKERNLNDVDKAYIYFWCQLLINHAPMQSKL